LFFTHLEKLIFRGIHNRQPLFSVWHNRSLPNF
jgi:hypothetical protein